MTRRKGALPEPVAPERVNQLLDLIGDSQARRGIPPTVRELRDAMGLRSISQVQHYLSVAVAAGLLLHTPGISRGYRLPHARV